MKFVIFIACSWVLFFPKFARAVSYYNIIDLGVNMVPQVINDAGNVANDLHIGGVPAICYFWSPGGGMIEIPPLDPDTNIAGDLNIFDEVVGYSNVDHPLRAFFWSGTEGLHELIPLQANHCMAQGINDLGQIAGNSN